MDPDRPKRHRSRFTGQALGATRPCSGRSMRKAHAHLAITDAAFGRVVDRLAASPAQAGADETTTGTVAETLLPLKQSIVTA
ncbi:hypothetical protein GCM10010145_65690 [Streptomyces ruber]|uniref:Uncharacterized protein n=3 Tax=Streptomyces TaxID=1883 RepID=A0A918EYM0_9ACTN|nr:hypothetical protein GCM10010145_65690 [Streptomyces ruber]